jgi:hypothetical protein
LSSSIRVGSPGYDAMQPAGYGGLDHERTPLQRPRFSRQAVLAAPLFAAVAGLVSLVVLELAPESALHRASLASALQAPITADHHHRNITSAAPHIVLAVLDDAGWDDWLETSDLAAPHVAALAESGLSLRSHYAAHECTPSRGSLLSGRYPVRLGLQRGVVLLDHGQCCCDCVCCRLVVCAVPNDGRQSN